MRTQRAAVWLALLVLAGCQGQNWETFSPADGKFSVEFPGPPTQKIQRVPTAAGELVAHSFAYEEKDYAYTVGYSDYPAGVMQPGLEDRILDSARDGAVENVRGKLVSEERIALNGHPGRNLKVTILSGRGTVDARIFLVGNRLYTAIASSETERASASDVRRFLDSFQILAQ
jgi:hypothetical protein